MTSIRIIDKRSEFVEIQRPWTSLCEAQHRGSPFLHWDWIDAFWSEMDLVDHRPVVLTAWNGAELVGAAPMQLGARRFGGIKCPVAAGLENAHSPQYTWLFSPDPKRADEAARELVRALAGLAGDRHVITWNNAPVDDPATNMLLGRFRRAGYWVVLKPNRYPNLLRFPDGAEALLGSLSRNMRSRIRKGWNRLERRGAIRFEETSQSQQLGGQLDLAWELERRSWKGRAGSAVALDPAAERFYGKLALALARRRVMSLFMLWCNDDLVAFLYGILDGERLHGLKFSYNPDFASVSPGYLMIWKILQWAEARGISCFNLGGQESEFKAHWGGDPYDIASFYAFQKRLQGAYMCAAHVGWKRAVARLPGVSAAARFRRARSSKRARGTPTAGRTT